MRYVIRTPDRRSSVTPRSAKALFRLTLPGLLATCALPSDESDTVYVTVDSGSRLVHRGDALTVQAHAWRSTPDESDGEIRGASFTWTISDSSVARVVPAEGGRAVVTGVGSGRAMLRAETKDFEEAPAAEVELRVANPIEIDRVTPESVRFGEQVTVEGVGLGGVERVFLGDGALIPDSASFLGDSVGAGSMRFWVAYPASSDRLLAVAKEGFSASAPDTTRVTSRDVFETEDGSDPIIPLDGPVVREPDVLFRNPALFLEFDEAGDFYRFVRSETSQPLTLVIHQAGQVVFGIDAMVSPLPIDDPGADWGMGGQTQRCGDFTTALPAAIPDSVVRVIEGPASADFEVAVFALNPSTYRMDVRRGRPRPDPRIEPDRFESNDNCRLADQNFENPERRMDLGEGAVSELLTLDYPYDLDWFKIQVPGEFGERRLVTIRTNPLPFGAADSSLVLNYLVDGEGFSSQSRGDGAEQTIAEEMSPGDYWIVVTDEAGVPTRYGLCVALGTACSLPTAARHQAGLDLTSAPPPAR
jgi:hypothetical protein